MGAGELRTAASQLRCRLEDVADVRLAAGEWELFQDVLRRASTALRDGDVRALRRSSTEVARLLGSRMRRAETEAPEWLEAPPAVREGTNELLDRLVEQEREQEQDRTAEPPDAPSDR